MLTTPAIALALALALALTLFLQGPRTASIMLQAYAQQRLMAILTGIYQQVVKWIQRLTLSFVPQESKAW